MKYYMNFFSNNKCHNKQQHTGHWTEKSEVSYDYPYGFLCMYVCISDNVLQSLINRMGKSLRNKQIIDQTDEEVHKNCTLNLFNKKSLKIHIRSLATLKSKKYISTSLKKKNFLKRWWSGSLSGLLDESQLECPICLQLLVLPTMKLCGHLYCYRCLMSHCEHSKRCCICREQSPKQAITSSLLAETIINHLILPQSKQYIKYLCRSTDSAEWIKRRKVHNVRIGLVVDFCDNLEVWRRGIVYRVFVQGHRTMAQVRISIKGEEFAEIVQADSTRLAPYTFFTRARYLLDFMPALPELEPAQNQFNCVELDKLDEDQYFSRANDVSDSDHLHSEDQVVVINSANSIVQQALDVLNFNIAQSYYALD